MSEEQKVHNWGKPFSIIALIFGIFALIAGLLALIPLVGLVFAIIALICAAIAILCGVPGVIGSASKGMAITALVFGGTMLGWAIFRYYWFVVVLAASVAA